MNVLEILAKFYQICRRGGTLPGTSLRGVSVSYRYAFLFLAAALTGGVATARTDWPWSWLAALCSLTSLLLVVAYASGNAGFLGKSADGRRAVAAVLVTAPYTVVNAALWSLVVSLSHEAPLGQIVPNLYFGRRLVARDRHRVIVPEFTSVLDLTAEFTEPTMLRQVPNYCSLPLLDGAAPSQELLRNACNWIDAALIRGSIYVHCALGHGRTGTILIAWLVTRRFAPDAPSALHQLQQVRQRLRLNREQWAAVLQFVAAEAQAGGR